MTEDQGVKSPDQELSPGQEAAPQPPLGGLTADQAEEQAQAAANARTTEAPPAAAKHIEWEDNAHIEWYGTDGVEVIKEQRCLRSTAEILQLLAATADTKSAEALSQKVKVYVNAKFEREKADGPLLQRVLGEGTLREAAIQLMMKSVPPQDVMVQFQLLGEYMSAHSSLKGVMITAVFGDAELAGFGYMSGFSKVSLDDIAALGTGAAQQAALFKDKMREKNPGVRFPDEEEKSRIIIPGR